jgi:transcriptional regulator with XRE-family HTH domain
MRTALAQRDIARVYKLLAAAGISQHGIARLTGQSQSEVSEILSGRQVKQVDVLERICDGLGAERGWMRLADDSEHSAYAEEDEEDVGLSWVSCSRYPYRLRCRCPPGSS